MKKKIICVLAALFVAFSFIGCKGKKDKLTLGFVPFTDADQLVEEIKPLTEKLSEKLGVEVDGYVATKYIGMVEGLGSDQIDFCFLPPIAYVLAHENKGAEVILSALNKHGEQFYYSQIVTRTDSNINDIKDLKGKKFAFVDASSTSGYLYPYIYLKNNGIDPEKDLEGYIFSDGHDKSIDLLLKGDIDGAATYVDAREKLKKEVPDVMEKLQVIGKCDPIPNICVAVNKNLDKDMKEKLKTALMEIAKTDDGLELLSRLFSIYGFGDVADSDFDTVRDVMNTLGIGLDE